MSKKNYIGLATTWHDSAMAIVDSAGRIRFAEGTERYLQNKRALHIRPDVYGRSLELAREHCEPDSEIVIASSWSDTMLPRAEEGVVRDQENLQKLSMLDGEMAGDLRSLVNFALYNKESQILQMSDAGHQLVFALRNASPAADRKIERRTYDHHLTHAATGCFTSPFSEAACLIVDGAGEHGGHSCYHFEDGGFRALPTSAAPGDGGSLGLFYLNLCQLCGFEPLAAEEWKVMGLAAYGEVDPEILAVLNELLQVRGLDIVPAPEPQRLAIRAKMKTWARKPGAPALSVANLAHTGQAFYTQLLLALARNLHEAIGSDNLVLGGGCALNSSANGRIVRETPFRSLHVYSAPADDGNAIGAALLAYYADHPDAWRQRPLQSPYLGSRLSAEAIENVRRFSGLAKMSACGDDAPSRAAELLAEGRIVGWVQGAAEFGPRALGNRSILADPRRADIKQTINERVKFREEFRPFAPSILEEFGEEYFEDYTPAPYMEKTLVFRPEVRGRVPGVVHEDGTGRLQSVGDDWNPRYRRLIEHFHALTGIPLVLNTSFNVMGKPIAHSVEDALAVFFTSGLDALFLEDLLIEK